MWERTGEPPQRGGNHSEERTLGQGLWDEDSGTSTLGRGLRDKHSGTRTQGQALWDKDSGTRTQGQGLWDKDSGTSTLGQGLRDEDSGTRTQGQGLRDKDSGTRTRGLRDSETFTDVWIGSWRLFRRLTHVRAEHGPRPGWVGVLVGVLVRPGGRGRSVPGHQTVSARDHHQRGAAGGRRVSLESEVREGQNPGGHRDRLHHQHRGR